MPNERNPLPSQTPNPNPFDKRIYERGVKVRETAATELGDDQTRYDWSSYVDQGNNPPDINGNETFTIYDIGVPVPANKSLVVSGGHVSCCSAYIQLAVLLRKDATGTPYAWYGSYFAYDTLLQRQNPFVLITGETLAIAFGNNDPATRRFWYSIDAYESVKR